MAEIIEENETIIKVRNFMKSMTDESQEVLGERIYDLVRELMFLLKKVNSKKARTLRRCLSALSINGFD